MKNIFKNLTYEYGPKKCFYWGAAAPQTPCNFYWGASSPPDPLAGGWQPPAPPCIPRGSASRALRFFLVPRLLDLPEPLRQRFQNFDLSEPLRQRFQNFDLSEPLRQRFQNFGPTEDLINAYSGYRNYIHPHGLQRGVDPGCQTGCKGG